MSQTELSSLKIKKNGSNNIMKGIPLVVAYHHFLKSLSAIINKNFSLLYMDKDVKRVFSP